MRPIPDGLIANLIKVPRGRDFGIGKLGVLTPSERIVGHSEIAGARSANPIRNDKSLAPYRDCLGGEFRGLMRCLGRGSFDRDDLKEAAGAAVRAPSYGAASLLFLGFGLATSVTRR